MLHTLHFLEFAYSFVLFFAYVCTNTIKRYFYWKGCVQWHWTGNYGGYYRSFQLQESLNQEGKESCVSVIHTCYYIYCFLKWFCLIINKGPFRWWILHRPFQKKYVYYRSVLRSYKLLAQANVMFNFCEEFKFSEITKSPSNSSFSLALQGGVNGTPGYLGEVIKVRSGDSIRITLQVHP